MTYWTERVAEVATERDEALAALASAQRRIEAVKALCERYDSADVKPRGQLLTGWVWDALNSSAQTPVVLQRIEVAKVLHERILAHHQTDPDYCGHCVVAWPCPTVAALTDTPTSSTT